MVYEFEGKTEREAIDTAVESLGLQRDEFDVEIVETQKAGLFNFNKKVVIRVHTQDVDGNRFDTTPAAPKSKPRVQTEVPKV